MTIDKMVIAYGGTAPPTKIKHVLCAMSELSTPFDKNMYPGANWVRNSEVALNLFNLSRPRGAWVIDQNVVQINNSRTT